MKKEKKPKLRSALRWALWIILAQFLLLNISASFYAYKFTHLYTPDPNARKKSSNFFVKTWHLFSGPKFYKSSNSEEPVFPHTSFALETKDKTRLQAWYCPLDSGALGTVILFHGLGGNKNAVLQQAVEFRSLGYNVAMIDSRAHGKSKGSVTTIGFKESEEVKLIYDYIKNMGENKIYLWGMSMGAVQVLKAIADYDLQPAGIILDVPFQHIQSHIKSRIHLLGFPKQPFGFFITCWIGIENGFNAFKFNTASYAKKVYCPVLLQYALEDQLVPTEEPKNIFDAIPGFNKKLVSYDSGHEPFLNSDPALWRREIKEFLNRAR